MVLMFGAGNCLDGCLRHGQYTLLPQICVWHCSMKQMCTRPSQSDESEEKQLMNMPLVASMLEHTAQTWLRLCFRRHDRMHTGKPPTSRGRKAG